MHGPQNLEKHVGEQLLALGVRNARISKELAETLDTNLIPPQNKGFFDRVLDFFGGEG